MSPTWSLEDVTQIARDAPYTFYLPSNAVLDKLTVGDTVKLMFHCEVENDKGWDAERMWVIITARDGANFTGTLDNNPYYIPDLKAGDSLAFQACHIMNTDLDEPVVPLAARYGKLCIVTRLVMDDGLPVRVLYRDTAEEQTDGDEMSGWNFFSGLEDDDYYAAGDNALCVSLGAVLNKGDGFVHLLDSEPGSEFVWDEAAGQFVPNEDAGV